MPTTDSSALLVYPAGFALTCLLVPFLHGIFRRKIPKDDQYICMFLSLFWPLIWWIFVIVCAVILVLWIYRYAWDFLYRLGEMFPDPFPKDVPPE